MIEGLAACFAGLADPRETRRCDHRLIDILVIAVCAVIACAESWGVQGGPNPDHFGGGNTGHCGGHWPGLGWAKLLISTSASRFLAFGSAMAGAASL